MKNRGAVFCCNKGRKILEDSMAGLEYNAQRVIEEVEKTVWTVVLTVVPVLLLAGCGAYICLRRRFR